ncbi:MAG: LytTR family transcriptional regulator [Lentimicrobiaceae bacterium]|nr:LytTR family transcriptional regulator [Lentimicrobiaceae bacterium]
MQSPIPSFLLNKKNTILLLVFVFFFSLLFLNIYHPFNSISWMANDSNLTDTQYFVVTLIIVSCGLAVLSFSRLIMYLLRNRVKITYLAYSIWIFGEILVMSVIYALVVKIGLTDARDFFDIAPLAMIYITLSLLLPYLVSWLYFSLQDKKIHLAQLVQMSKYIDEESYFAIQPDKYNLIHFHDDKGTLRLSIKFHNLFYIESSDNYVNIYYESKGRITRFLLRKSMKSIEELYSEYPLVRCHRSYIVNVNKVKVLRKDKEGLFLDLDYLDLPKLPISKTYSDQVLGLFNQ